MGADYTASHYKTGIEDLVAEQEVLLEGKDHCKGRVNQ